MSYLTQFLLRKLTIYGMVSKSVACVALVRKAAYEVRITIFFKSFGVRKINELVVIGKKLTNNFACLITSGLGPDVAHGPPVGLRWSKQLAVFTSGFSSQLMNSMEQIPS
jgi:hypothetical protein